MNNNETVIDIDGNVYHTVTIGTQVWMVENLNTTHYNDGTEIPYSTWNYSKTEAYCDYDNDQLTSAIFGRLYNWYAVNTGMLCPKGWHVPSDTEWETLIKYLGGNSEAGGKLKKDGTNHWESPNTGANNSSGFTALPGGICHDRGTFHGIGENGCWWSSTEFYRVNSQEPNCHNARYQWMYYNSSSAMRRYETNSRSTNCDASRFSVRCLRDN